MLHCQSRLCPCCMSSLPCPPAASPACSQRVPEAAGRRRLLGPLGGSERHAARRQPPLSGLLLTARTPLQHVAPAGGHMPPAECATCRLPVRPLASTGACGVHWPASGVAETLVIACFSRTQAQTPTPFLPAPVQLMLPVGVHTLVHEKEQHLRLMMKMQVGGREQPALRLHILPAICPLPSACNPPRFWRFTASSDPLAAGPG
jgi:hypothetical protein